MTESFRRVTTSAVLLPCDGCSVLSSSKWLHYLALQDSSYPARMKKKMHKTHHPSHKT